MVKLITTSSPEAVTDLTGHVGRQVHGDFRTLLMWSATTWAVKGVPSENFTPGRIVSVNVLPPLENLKALARPGTSLPPSCSSISWP